MSDFYKADYNNIYNYYLNKIKLIWQQRYYIQYSDLLVIWVRQKKKLETSYWNWIMLWNNCPRNLYMYAVSFCVYQMFSYPHYAGCWAGLSARWTRSPLSSLFLARTARSGAWSSSFCSFLSAPNSWKDKNTRSFDSLPLNSMVMDLCWPSCASDVRSYLL